jgi:type II secretory pathway pseudopilin PulG
MPKKTTKGFTIVELLTVMSIIIILLGVLVPALSKVKRFARNVVQRGQFHEISKGLELFRNDHQDNYPDSGASAPTNTGTTVGYCGAMKLCEAMLGQDGMGFNPLSSFRADGTDPNGSSNDLYPFDLCASTDPSVYSGSSPSKPELADNIRQRIKYIDSENIKATRLKDLYSWYNNADGASFYDNTIKFQTTTDVYPFAYPNPVITDVFLHPTSRCNNNKIGMPVLYFKADPSKVVHDVNTIWNPNPNIYNFDDNYALIHLGLPWDNNPPSAGGGVHPMGASPLLFYKEITNTQVTSTPRPHREDSYILMSAGFDGLYGTRDDVFNFTD